MLESKKAEPPHAELDSSSLRDTAPTESESASSCAVETRQSNKTGNDLERLGHGVDVEAAASDRVRQIQQIDDEIRRAVDLGAIEHVPVGDLKPNPHNARKHPESQIELLAASIRQFGFVGAIIADEGNVIISGHGRHAAAKCVGMDVVPCIRVTNLTAKAKIAFALADNRLAELSDWDELALASQLEQLVTPDLDFDFEVTGFDTVDADRLLGPEPDPLGRKSGTGEFSMDPDDSPPRLETEGPSVSQPGDMWHLGSHCVVHGDALNPRSYEVLLADEVAAQIVTDPPYNVPNRGHVSSKPFREFPMAAGEMSPKEFGGFLTRAFSLAAGTARDGAIFHVFMDWHHLDEMLTAINDAGLEVKNLCVWAKPSAGMGSFYRSQHELIFVLKHGTAKHINNFGLGARGRNRSNVWRYPAVRGVRRGVSDPDGGHPTVKPVALIMDAIRDCSRRHDIVLDPFGGSGTTLIAAERVGRRARLIEIDGHYVHLIIRRWQAVVKRPAVRASDGRSYDQIAAARDGTEAVGEPS
jgi:DNA modification methylase